MDFPLIESVDVWTTPLFFTEMPLGTATLGCLVSAVKDAQCKQTAVIDSHVAETAKHGLHESHLQWLESSIPVVSQLKTDLEALLLAVVEEVNRPYWPESAQAQAEIVESWYHVTTNGGFHDVHSHPNCSWCGILCLSAGEANIDARNGVNRFYDPRINAEHFLDAGTQYLNGEGVWDIAPKAGQLVIFPSYLKHSALPYFGESERIVLAFNAKVAFIE